MDKMIELIQKLEQARENMGELKLWLAQKETVEYYKWKEENPKDRTAMDKIVTQLKMNNENWLLKEQEYLKAKNNYDVLKDVNNLVNNMLYSQNYAKEDIEDFIASFI